jgi:hypothetical protein
LFLLLFILAGIFIHYCCLTLSSNS